MTNNLPKPERQQSSVAIQGIDTSTPDTTVADGKCETLHNMHFSAGAWRPAYPFTVKHTIPNHVAANYLVVYHHPAAGDSVYILQDEGGYRYWSCDLADDNPSPIEIATFEAKQDISHFGNVLIFSDGMSTKYYFYRKNSYTSFEMPSAPRVRITTRCTPIKPRWYTNGNGWIDFSKMDNSVSGSMSVVWPISNVSSLDPLVPTYPDSTYENTIGAWHGEIAVFVAYRMVDGTILSPSPLHIIASEIVENASSRYFGIREINGERLLCLIQSGSHTAIWEDGAMQFVLPSIIAEVNKSKIDSNLITDVVVFATRIHSIFNYEYYTNNPLANETISLLFADNKLPEQPFYLIKSLPIKDSFNLEVKLDSRILDAQGAVYVPNNNIHHTSAAITFDYNNRLHFANTILDCFPGYNFNHYKDAERETDLRTYTSITELSIDGDAFHAKRQDSLDSIPGSRIQKPKILTYPDYRASKFIVALDDELQNVFVLKAAEANNIAYYIPAPSNQQKFPDIEFIFNQAYIRLEDANNHTLITPNKLQVSASNNPFSFPFENTYTIGSAENTILALQSAAIEMSDAKFGEFPLYAFTTEGVFALQAGNETLYASIIPINYDRVINPRTLAINGAIVYITEEGVKMLTAQGATLISAPLNDSRNLPDREFLEYCTPIWDKVHDELLLQTVERDEAYVYNLGLGYWSTRALHGVKLNTDELWSNTHIIDLRDEDAQSDILPYRITTRPMKLGTVEFKRIETFIPRLHVMNPLNLTITLEGSNDPASGWHTLRTFNDEIDSGYPLTFRRTPFSCKYLRFIIDGTATGSDGGSFALTNIDFEWYLRHAHRMR